MKDSIILHREVAIFKASSGSSDVKKKKKIQQKRETNLKR